VKRWECPFKKIVNQLPKTVTNICLSGVGEPFLNEDYIKMAKYAYKKGFYVEVYNNGSLFNPEVLKYTGEVNFSVDAIDEELLKEIRKNVKTSILFENIKLAIKNKKDCKININFTVNYKNYKQAPKLFEFADLVGIDNVFIQAVANNYYPNSKKYNQFKNFVKKNELIDWEFIVNSYKKNYTFRLTIWYPRKLKGFCAWGFSNIYITSNLDIIQCCQKVTNPIIFGNLLGETFDDTYKRMEHFRQKHINNEKIFICDSCPY